MDHLMQQRIALDWKTDKPTDRRARAAADTTNQSNIFQQNYMQGQDEASYAETFRGSNLLQSHNLRQQEFSPIDLQRGYASNQAAFKNLNTKDSAFQNMLKSP